MKKVLGDTPIESFKTPEVPETGKPVLDGQPGTETVYKIDKITGLLATESTPPELIEEKTFFDPHSIHYFVDKNDPLGDTPEDPSKDPQFDLWESRILEWAKKEIETSTSTLTLETPPTEEDDVHVPKNLPDVSIKKPKNNQTITEATLSIDIKVSAKRGVEVVEYFINDNLVDIVYSAPFDLEKSINFLYNGFHNLKVRACDDVGNCTIASREFNLLLSNPPETKDVDITFSNLSNGVALTNIDFPLKINLDLTNPSVAARVNLYYKEESATDFGLFETIQPISGSSVSATWEDSPPTGAYQIYAEAISWSKQTTKTNTIILNINNNIKEEE